MQRANQRGAAEQAVGERAAAMGAFRLNGKHLAGSRMKDGEFPALHFDVAAAADYAAQNYARHDSADEWAVALRNDWREAAPAGRIEAVEKVAGAGRVGWIHPDCGFWMLKRTVADRKIAALAPGRDLFLGLKG